MQYNLSVLLFIPYTVEWLEITRIDDAQIVDLDHHVTIDNERYPEVKQMDGHIRRKFLFDSSISVPH